MQVKVMDLDDNEEVCDFWGKEKTPRANMIYHNETPWEANVEYKFQLTFYPGAFAIQISTVETGELLESFTVKDDTYKSGRFGFYNYSQPNISCRGFSATRLPPKQYSYQVETDAKDDSTVSYELVEAPKGMKIDSKGLITWDKEVIAEGNYKVHVEAFDQENNRINRYLISKLLTK